MSVGAPHRVIINTSLAIKAIREQNCLVCIVIGYETTTAIDQGISFTLG
jgi:hypothetical protein